MGAADVQLSADELSEIEDGAFEYLGAGRPIQRIRGTDDQPLERSRTLVLRNGAAARRSQKANRVGSTREGGQWRVLS